MRLCSDHLFGGGKNRRKTLKWTGAPAPMHSAKKSQTNAINVTQSESMYRWILTGKQVFKKRQWRKIEKNRRKTLKWTGAPAPMHSAEKIQTNATNVT